MGVKAVTSWLNQNGYRTRVGAKWGIGPVHAMLTNTVYAGKGRFNRTHSRTRAQKSDEEVVTFEAPIIIDPALFEQVQARLKARNPRLTPPRIVSGPILLTGLAFCASCDGAMTLRTGTSRSGKVHRYYTCSTCARAGKTACKSRSIRMDRLDHLVTDQLIDRLLAPDRLKAILETLAARRLEQAVGVDERIAALEAQAQDADARLRRLYKLVEDGLADMDDILKDRITALKAERETAYAAAERAKGTNGPPVTIAPAKIEAFGNLMRGQLTSGDIPFRKAYLGAIIDRVEVDDTIIRIMGRKDVLATAIASSGTPVPPVRSFVRRWRAGKDSNPRPSDP